MPDPPIRRSSTVRGGWIRGSTSVNFIRNIGIGARLGAGFAILVALLLLQTLASLSSIRTLDATVRDAVGDRYAKVVLADEIERNANVQATELRNAIIAARDADEAKASLGRVRDAGAANDDRMRRLASLIHSLRGQELFKQLEQTRAAYAAERGAVVKLIESGQADVAGPRLLKELRPKQQAFFEATHALSAFQDRLMKDGAAQAEADSHAAVVLTLVLITVAVLLAALLGWWLTRSITAPIREAMQVAETVAAGDLTVRVEVTGKDEPARLLHSLRQMTANLVDIVGQVQRSSDNIATGSAQIAGGNADLSQRTEEQASNLEQTAASMEQLTATVKQNSATARQATQLADSASAAASQGGEVVGRVVGTMDDIAASSKRMSDIIGVIDGIAFQTNILALNAAVEAARAGEQGRGFAVVASEVRSLAQRSAEAAREIKTLIGQSVEKVEAGSRLVGEAGQAMQAIVVQVRRVNDLIGEISSASLEQTQGISQVGAAIQQLDQVTQQNAALVEESAAAADSLKSRASELATVVGRFRLADGAAAAGAAPARRPAAPRRAAPAAAAKPAWKSPSKPAATPAPAGTAAPAAAAEDEWATF
ncbi:MAG: MCP four helix bundle domain-containing protein [Burkholderiales bacterium]|nr:MCP four helix bundle domain-containing protein [Burkholderiales bacterium]